MPLIVLCGYPSCGKTTFANQLAKYLKETANINAIVANEESLLLNKKTAFQDAAKEKLTRGVLKSYVDQKLNNKSVVILDSLNYIKGFRYELHCMARELRSSHCVVWVRSNEQVAEEWNRNRPEEDRFDDSLFFELRQRFEAPNPSNRWDFPLFHADMTPSSVDTSAFESITAGLRAAALAAAPGAAAAPAVDDPPPVPDAAPSASVSTSEAPESKKLSGFRRAPKKQQRSKEPTVTPDTPAVPEPVPAAVAAPVDPKHQKLTFSGTVREDANSSNADAEGSVRLPADDATPERCCEMLLQFVKTAAAPAANPATVATPHLKANMLYLLDKISQEIVATIVNHQNNAANGTDPLLFTEYDRALELHRTVSLAELQRHRRQFVKVNSQIPPSNQIDIGASFIEFLALQL